MIRVEVITPERLVFEGEGRLVTIPTKDGTLGVGAGHIPLLASLKAGEVMIHQAGGKDEFLAVAGGFVEILPNVVRIMADSAFHATELDESVIKQAVIDAERAKAQAKDTVQFAAATSLIELNLAKLKVVQRKKAHGSARTSSLDN